MAEDQILDSKINRISAAMAYSNYGLLGFSIEIKKVLDWIPDRNYDLGAEVDSIGGGILEDEGQFNMFLREAESWKLRIKKIGIMEFQKQYNYPWIQTIMEISHDQ